MTRARLSLLAVPFYLTVAALSQPGTQQDPVVSRSYLRAFHEFRLVSVPPERKLRLGTGTEVVLRSGRAQVSGGNLLNLSRGKDLAPEEALPLNHHLLCPREDGRGLTTRTTALILIRGPYRFE